MHPTLDMLRNAVGKSMWKEDVARQIISTISTELGSLPTCVMAATRDRASGNAVAMQCYLW